MIKEYVKEHNLTLHTFAEENALCTGYLLLALGDTCYAEKSSRIGQIGVNATAYFKDLGKHKIDTNTFGSKR